MAYQWYPGHMTKTMRSMQEDLKLIDLVIELAEARIPRSSRNPELKNIANGKAHLLILNKADLADPSLNDKWAAAYKAEGVHTVFIDSRANKNVKSLKPVIMEACKEKIERNRRKGIMNRPIRAMVVGVPNAGKSTFINSFVGRSSAKTGNKPGVTKGKQWIRLSKELELLDTPGVLWPKIEEDFVGENLAMIGSIKDEIMNIEELSLILMNRLVDRHPGALAERFGIEEMEDRYEMLKAIAVARQCLKSGAEPDTEKAARLLIHDFRSGALGRMTLETPDD
ncbi:MAG: ribosome biogenesis GTPase YlqF [Lachnospiraceae bacterium]|nr:ribosome biogenesis GTPase YlqF [Candidatus Equihabitans merdae]